MNSHQIRQSGIGESKKIQRQVKRHPLVLVLDNVVDTYNIGSFFRLADALAAEKIYLCGQVVTPPNIKIHRASIGTWKLVPWQHSYSTTDILLDLKKQGYQLIACEQTPNSRHYQKTDYRQPIAIVAGSESQGLSPETLSLVDQIVEIPMHGINKSLNVLVATAIVGYHFLSLLTGNPKQPA